MCVASVSPGGLVLLLLCSLRPADGAEDRHVVRGNGGSVPEQAERIPTEHGLGQLVPPLGHAGGGRNKPL